MYFKEITMTRKNLSITFQVEAGKGTLQRAREFWMKHFPHHEFWPKPDKVTVRNVLHTIIPLACLKLLLVLKCVN